MFEKYGSNFMRFDPNLMMAAEIGRQRDAELRCRTEML